ncbi:Peptidase aspartic, catalytic [Cucumis melo var. makuwa]|uniref:Peptidase aspartic, catalytic n=1 Tax=Cucumis melo var. makuwa TaxID=1194695 RepID=A0A5D3DVN5_CUCMM|nr:Peptidase aspartic, catalytic [Cucumis melo var. makuwa]TYK27877.1 Peptidase aspartic, catalytic [Cucumis melo var. makuwa]
MDLVGPMETESLGGKRYVLVVVDDYSRYTWVCFLKGRSDTIEIYKNLCLKLQREKGKKITRIRSDHGKEFDNEGFNSFCLLEGIHHKFSAPITPEQNGVVERKNRTLQEMARVMIHAKNLPLCFWAEAVNTVCHIHNKLTGNTVRNGMQGQNNESFSAIKQMNDEEDETSNMSEARTMSTVEVSKVDNPSDDPGKSLKKSLEEIITKKSELIPFAHVKKNHPASSIIGDPSAGMQTRRKEKIDYIKMVADLCYTSTIEPSTVDSALKDEYWLNAMQDELLRFRRNNV